MRVFNFVLPVLFTFCGCTLSAVEYPATCTLPTPVPESSAAPGTAVWATGGSLTSLNDTVVTVGSAQAEVLVVDRTGCDALDTCRSDNGCGTCVDCDACAADEASCVERVKFKVPAVGAGDQAFTVRNAYGTSGTGSITVIGADTGGDTGDTDTGDTGGTDTGDTGGTDTGGTDTGAPPPSCLP